MSYQVKRIFPTLQGEGYWSGTPAVFVRLVACNMWSGYEEDREEYAEANGADCPLWCDTDFTKEGSEALTSGEIVGRIVREVDDPIDHVVFTGGEPLLQMDSSLVQRMHAHGLYVHVETNGTLSVRDTFEDVYPDWICCSPKLPQGQLQIEEAHELKLIVPDYHPEDYAQLAERVRVQDMAGQRRRPLYVQPEDGPRLDEAMDECVRYAQQDPRWQVSTQQHKTLGID